MSDELKDATDTAQSACNGGLCASCGRSFSVPFSRHSDRAVICAGCFADEVMGIEKFFDRNKEAFNGAFELLHNPKTRKDFDW